MNIERIGNAKLITGDNVEVLRQFPDDFVDLTVTSPPYDNLRTYNGFTWDFDALAKELYRVTKPGGVVVWVVGDATVKGSETGTSFKQALYFKDVCGFNLHDTMIYAKPNFSAVGALQTRYAPVFEYMFILTKGKLKTFNPIKDKPNKNAGKKASGTVRQVDGTTKPMSKEMVINDLGQRYNIWEISPQTQKGNHPAPFPEALANDHIISWSNEGDVVLDPFMGSGTTGKMALLNNRKFIGVELSPEYVEIAKKRIDEAKQSKV